MEACRDFTMDEKLAGILVDKKKIFLVGNTARRIAIYYLKMNCALPKPFQIGKVFFGEVEKIKVRDEFAVLSRNKIYTGGAYWEDRKLPTVYMSFDYESSYIYDFSIDFATFGVIKDEHVPVLFNNITDEMLVLQPDFYPEKIAVYRGKAFLLTNEFDINLIDYPEDEEDESEIYVEVFDINYGKRPVKKEAVIYSFENYIPVGFDVNDHAIYLLLKSGDKHVLRAFSHRLKFLYEREVGDSEEEFRMTIAPTRDMVATWSGKRVLVFVKGKQIARIEPKEDWKVVGVALSDKHVFVQTEHGIRRVVSVVKIPKNKRYEDEQSFLVPFKSSIT